MAKIKIFLLIFITFLLTLFIYENSVLAPPIKLFGKEIIQIHISIIIITSFVLGAIFSWLGHFTWSRARRRSAELALRDQKAPESQDTDQQEEKEK